MRGFKRYDKNKQVKTCAEKNSAQEPRRTQHKSRDCPRSSKTTIISVDIAGLEYIRISRMAQKFCVHMKSMSAPYPAINSTTLGSAEYLCRQVYAHCVCQSVCLYYTVSRSSFRFRATIDKHDESISIISAVDQPWHKTRRSRAPVQHKIANKPSPEKAAPSFIINQIIQINTLTYFFFVSSF